VTLLSCVLSLWNSHLAPISAQIYKEDNTSALCVCWRVTHDPNFGTIYVGKRSQFWDNTVANFKQVISQITDHSDISVFLRYCCFIFFCY